MFQVYPAYSPYRTMKKGCPVGEDVYALQTALAELDLYRGQLDGAFGPGTDAAARDAQELLRITVDGLVGGGTQQALVKRLANRARTINQLPEGLAYGQCQHESSCRLGNYSPRRADGSYDAGVSQRNSAFTPVKIGFHVEKSIELLGAHLGAYGQLFSDLDSERRAWELAAGSWNAPAYACRIGLNEGAAVPVRKPSWWPAGVTWVGPCAHGRRDGARDAGGLHGLRDGRSWSSRAGDLLADRRLGSAVSFALLDEAAGDRVADATPEGALGLAGASVGRHAATSTPEAVGASYAARQRSFWAWKFSRHQPISGR